MRRAIVAVAISGMFLGAASLPAAAQEGIVIQNNGVDSSDSARGSDSVNISRASGASSSNNGSGVNNESGRVVKENNRDRKDRDSRNKNSGDEAPAETGAAAPAEGDYQAYTEDGGWVEPVAAPAEMSADAAAIDPSLPVQLPNTGAGNALPLAPVAAAALAAIVGAASVRRRQAA